LATDGQTPQVADATVAFDGLKTLQVQTQFTAQVTLDDILAFLDRVNDLRELLFVEVLASDARVNVGFLEDDLCVRRADAVDVAERDVDAFLARDFHTNDACHNGLALPLFVSGIRADDTNDAFSPHDFAI